MKKIFFVLVCIWLLFPLGVSKGEVWKTSQPTYHAEEATSDTVVNWNAVAEGMVNALVKHFWGASFEAYPNRYYFNYESDLSNMSTNHYWPQAHAMDVIVDAYLRTSNQQYLNFYPLWWEGAPKFNFSGKDTDPWWNEFVDDMEWIALAQLRMYESTQREQYLLKARQLYDDWIWTTWGPEDEKPWNGGITWKTDVSKSKNACSNGPAAIIAARIYNMYDAIIHVSEKPKHAYLEEALKIYKWLRDNLYNAKTGKVYDNMNLKGEVSPMVFTYNQGTFIGAAHELYKITGDEAYLSEAVKAASYVVDQMSTNSGVLKDASSGDGGLFNGIFFRYFVKLVNEPNLDLKTRKKFHDYISLSAKVMWENGVNQESMLYGGNWWSAPTSRRGVSLTAHLSGCMLMEAMCVLEPLPK
ncbi:hypothetical protein ORI89_11375 [Sphingobacterium sp. UT-1RO-CII-1]|uniref:glycoside hydrolase family 76 protein n=1 Tax=Sphingobacterium sp. UT-1RO-CII-1 TaxID=2995225 RepID=UPI00227AF046|nr:glycoside hydrolase family 76 protein [Sphingobacterium sp. UT-1RO-CII-1]MCY4780254.1 hypothetical protein [Sphingobacterium sp. UT-1RO-CII-1]